jgi:hypothetical protein
MTAGEKPLLLIYAQVGRVVRTPEGLPQVQLQGKWEGLAKEVNADIQRGNSLVGNDMVPRPILPNVLDAEHLQTLADVVENRSAGALLVIPTDEADSDAAAPSG